MWKTGPAAEGGSVRGSPTDLEIPQCAFRVLAEIMWVSVIATRVHRNVMSDVRSWTTDTEEPTNQRRLWKMFENRIFAGWSFLRQVLLAPGGPRANCAYFERKARAKKSGVKKS